MAIFTIPCLDSTLVSDSLYRVYAVVIGILDKNLVKEDQIVKEGTPLLQIIRTSPKLNMENARLALEPTKEKKPR